MSDIKTQNNLLIKWAVAIALATVSVLALLQYINYSCLTNNTNWLINMIYGDSCLSEDKPQSTTQSRQRLSVRGTTIELSDGGEVNLAFLIGASGPQGEQGLSGASGATGATGIAGVAGSIGPPGPAGTGAIPPACLPGEVLTSDGINLVCTAVAGGGTLDSAYGFGGPGAGRVINAEPSSALGVEIRTPYDPSGPFNLNTGLRIVGDGSGQNCLSCGIGFGKLDIGAGDFSVEVYSTDIDNLTTNAFGYQIYQPQSPGSELFGLGLMGPGMTSYGAINFSPGGVGLNSESSMQIRTDGGDLDIYSDWDLTLRSNNRNVQISGISISSNPGGSSVVIRNTYPGYEVMDLCNSQISFYGCIKITAGSLLDPNFSVAGSAGSLYIASGSGLTSSNALWVNTAWGTNTNQWVAIGGGSSSSLRLYSENFGGSYSIGPPSAVSSSSVAIGDGVTVTGHGSLALGYSTSTSGLQVYALGSFNTVNGYTSTAVGYGNNIYTSGDQVALFGSNNSTFSGVAVSVVVGVENTIRDGSTTDFILGRNNNLGMNVSNTGIVGNNNSLEYDIAGAFIIGRNNLVRDSSDGLLLAGNTNSVGQNNTYVSLIGSDNSVGAKNQSVHLIGVDNDAYGNNTDVFVFGKNNDMGNNNSNSLLIGENNYLSGPTDIAGAVGYYNSIVNSTHGYAIGTANYVGTNHSYAFGEANHLSNGQKQIGVGIDNTLNFGQELITFGINNSALSYDTQLVVGMNNISGANYAHLFGFNNSVAGAYSSTIGGGNINHGVLSNAYGMNNSLGVGFNTSYLNAFGFGNNLTGDASSAFGSNNIVSGKDAFVVGNSNTAGGQNALVVGGNNDASGLDGIVFGRDNNQTGIQGVVLGINNDNDGFASYAIGLSNSIDSGSTQNYTVGATNTVDGSIYTYSMGQDLTQNAVVRNILIGTNLTTTDSSVIQLGQGSIAMTIQGDTIGGNVGIGTTTPAGVAGSRNLEVTGGIRVGTLGASTAMNVCINGSGDLSACSSSGRYKDNITDLGLGLDAIMNLRAVSFDWKESGESDFGFVAEEVAAVSSLLATYNKEGEIQGVKYDQLTAILTNAIQEQEGKIDQINTSLASSGLIIDDLATELRALSDKLDKNIDQTNQNTTDIEILKQQNQDLLNQIQQLKLAP